MPPKLVTIGPSAPRRGPEREALAQRIARVAELTEALDRVRQARAKIGPTYEAINAVERAEAALLAAQEREPRRLVDEILGRGSAKSLVAAAEAALTAAKGEESRRREMHKLLDAEEGEMQSAIGIAEMRRRDAIRDVLAADPAVAALYTEYGPLGSASPISGRFSRRSAPACRATGTFAPRRHRVAASRCRGARPSRHLVATLTRRSQRTSLQPICRRLRHEKSPSHFQRRWGPLGRCPRLFMEPSKRPRAGGGNSWLRGRHFLRRDRHDHRQGQNVRRAARLWLHQAR